MLKTIVLFPLGLALLAPPVAAQELPAPAPPPTRQAAPHSPRLLAPNSIAGAGSGVQSTAPGGPLPPDSGDSTVIIVVPGAESPTNPPGHGAGVGGVAIGGLSDVAAYARLRRILEPQLGVAVKLGDGQKVWSISRAALGASIPYRHLMDSAHDAQTNVPLRFAVDSARARATLASLAVHIRSAGNARHQDAEIDLQSSLSRVVNALQAVPIATNIDLTVRRTPTAQIRNIIPAPLADYPYLVAAYSTPYNARIRGRSKNLRMAAAHVNHTVVPTGSVFSTNKTIGPRDEADGWREALMFVDGKIVSGIGSGICQCSSTLYNAALLAGFKIVERHPHSFRVTYVPASRDAAIYWGQKDMRFRNTGDTPIWIQTYLSHDRFYVRFWGKTPRSNKVTVSSMVTSHRHGTHSVSFREITDSTGSHRQRLSSDYYKPHP